MLLYAEERCSSTDKGDISAKNSIEFEEMYISPVTFGTEMDRRQG
jgi:hypothetical protein